MVRARTAATALALGLAACGCSAARRGGENVRVVATFPLHAVTTPAARMESALRVEPFGAAVLSPLLVPYFLLEDAFLTGVSAADAALTPLYAPFDVRELRLYDFSRGLPRLHRTTLRGLEAFERDAGECALFVAVVYGIFRAGGPASGSMTVPADPPREP